MPWKGRLFTFEYYSIWPTCPPWAAHTNSRGLAASIFANVSTLDDGTHVQIRTSDENTPLLEMLHELIFCCDSLITSESSISWVAALATKAVVVSPSATEPHIGFKLHGVTVT